jgi:type IV secretory pathway VirB2 component (pilin)
MKIKTIKYLVLPSLLFLFMATTVFSAPVQLDNPLPGKSFDETVRNIIDAALGISGVLALIAFVYGGILWMVSRGDQAMVSKGKNVMIWAVWGLVVIFASYAILEFVFGALYGGGGEVKETAAPLQE